MCLSPINIKNPRRFYRVGLDRVSLSVPCGKCLECQNRRVNDWFVRLAYEFYDYKEKNGAVYFPTLTYNKYCVPYLDTTQEHFKVLNDVSGNYVDGVTPTVPQFKHMGFCKQHVQKFFKSLRQLANSPYLPKRFRLGIAEGIKYFVVSEFGGEKERPHYHALLFMPKRFDSAGIWTLKKVLELAWSDRIAYKDAPDVLKKLLKTPYYMEILNNPRKGLVETKYFFVLPPRKGQTIPQIFKRKGFVSWSVDHGAEVKSINCIRYILKYLAKDSRFMKKPCVTLLNDYVKDLPAIKTLTNDVQIKAIKELKDFFPFNLSSSHLGESLYKLLDLSTMDEDSEEEKKALDTLMSGVVHIPNDTVMYGIPKYIIRRLYYYVEDVGQIKNVCRVNEIGKKVLKMKFDSTINYLVDSYKMIMSDEFLKLFSDEDKQEFQKEFYRPFSDFQELYSNTFVSMFGNPLEYLAKYSLCFRGVSYYNNREVECMCIEQLMQKVPVLFCKKIDFYNVDDEKYYFNLPTPVSELPNDVLILHSHYIFNRLSVFDNFDFILDSLNFIRNKVQYRELKKRDEKKKYNHYIHSLYVKYMYN